MYKLDDRSDQYVYIYTEDCIKIAIKLYGTKPIQTQEVKNLLIRLFVLKRTTMDRKLLSASEHVPAKFEKIFGTSNVTLEMNSF